MITYLGLLVQLCCGDRGTLQRNTAGVCEECSQFMDHTGFATAQGRVCFPDLHCSGSRVPCKDTVPRGPCIMKCTSQVYATQVLGYSTRAQTGWAVCFVSFPGLNSSGNWVLGEHTVPGGPFILITSRIQTLGFLGSSRENCLRYAMCLLWGADLKMKPSWGQDCSSPMPSSSGCCTPASLP